MKKLNFSGIQIKASQVEIQDETLFNEDFESFDTWGIRYSRNAEKQTLEFEDDDVLEFVFEDGGEWITNGKNIDELFENSPSTDGSKSIGGEYDIHMIGSKQNSNRGIPKILVKILRHFKKPMGAKKMVEKFCQTSGGNVDNRIVPIEMLALVSHEFYLTKFSRSVEPKGRYLLLIHGFASNTLKSFSGLPKEEQKQLWSKLTEVYNQRILAFDHHTIMKSPIDNALTLMKLLPKGIEMDIITMSRGGLIADLLSKFSIGSLPENLDEFKPIKDKDQKNALVDLVSVSKMKELKVGKVIRVACPANGTTLLTKRLDHFLNGILAGLGALTGGSSSILYKIVKGFLREMLNVKSDPSIFPGISSMAPDSDFQKMINNLDDTSGELYNIVGASAFGKNMGHSILFILTRFFYWKANDFVVPSESMLFGAIRKKGMFAYLTKDSNTNHFSYLINKKSRNAIENALFSKDISPLGFKKISKQEREYKLLEKFNTKRGESNDKEKDLIDIVFGNYEDPEQIQIRIKLSHGHLRYADHPVMVGHFAHNGILSAEKALDKVLGGKLSDRYKLNLYPQEVRENLIVLNKPSDRFSEPKGGLIIGLGDYMEFSELKFRNTVEAGILEYAIYIKEHKEILSKDIEYNSISSICIGSGYAGFGMSQALVSILYGITKANEKIQVYNSEISNNSIDQITENDLLVPIEVVEFIEIYEDQMYEAYQSLKEIAGPNFTLNILPPLKPIKKLGRMKRMSRQMNSSWWFELILKHVNSKEESSENGNEQYTFLMSKKRAKTNDFTEYYSFEIVNDFLKSIELERVQDEDVWNTLFQLIVPNQIKSIFRNQHNILLRIDEKAAAYPWEMLHDKNYDNEPTFANTGIVRQLITSTRDSIEKVVRTKSALIIGDPIYKDYGQLAGAKKEAEEVDLNLRSRGWTNVTTLINKEKIEIVNSFFKSSFRILHISGHGVYNHKGRSGLVVGDQVLDTVFFSNLNNIPEFVFINCCNSGTIDPRHEETYRERHKLAASLGVQLIEMGVSAAIITGWAVDDIPAREFAQIFYDEMLNGATFGKATQKARKKIFDKYQFGSTTWGAYQCYGDPWYQLDKKRNSNDSQDVPDLEEEMLIQLFNLKSWLSHADKYDQENIISILSKICKKAEKIDSPFLYEAIAQLYSELDMPDKAEQYYIILNRNQYNDMSVKSLEQFPHFRVKVAMEKKTISQIDRDEILKDFNNLLNIEKSKERYSLLGSAYKRMILLQKYEKSDLIKMKEAYHEAFKLTSMEDGIRTYAYSYFNFKTGEYLIDSKSFEAKKMNLISKKIRQMKSRNEEFFDEIINTSLHMFNLLLASNSKQINVFLKKVIDTYTQSYILKGKPRDLKSETEHIEFIIKALPYSNDDLKEEKSKAFEDFLDILNNLQKVK